MRQLKRWKCAVCGEEVVEGQLFTFYSKGPVHWECLEREVAPALYKDVDAAALLRLDRYLHEGIVLAKQLEYIAQSEETKTKIRDVRKQLEAMAARLIGDVTSKIHA